MNKLLLPAVFLLSSLTVQSQVFEAYIAQDGEYIDIENYTVYLENKPFYIVTYMSEPSAFLLHASTNPESYNLAVNGYALDEIPGACQGCGASEELFNPRKELFLTHDNTVANYWYFQDDNNHRFDVVEPAEEGSGYFTYRLIESMGGDLESYDVNSIGNRTVYLLFVVSQPNADYTSQTEIWRMPLALVFEQ